MKSGIAYSTSGALTLTVHLQRGTHSVGTRSHRHRSANVYCVPTPWQAHARLWRKTVRRGHCLRLFTICNARSPLRHLGEMQKLHPGVPPQARRLHSCFLDQQSPGSTAGPQRGMEIEGEPAHFFNRDSKGGVDRPCFHWQAKSHEQESCSEPSKNQVRSPSQCKHNPFQQAAGASEIQRDSPPSSHQPDQSARNPAGVSKQKVSGILWSSGVIFLYIESTQSILFHNQVYIPLWNSLLWRFLKTK